MNPQQLISPTVLANSTWSVIVKNWKILLGIPAVLFATGIIVMILFSVSIFSHSIILMIVCALLYLSIVILGIALYPALINTIHRISTESSPALTIKGQYRFGFSIFWSFLLLMIISVFIAYGSLALLIVPGIIFGVYTAFSLFALVVDGKKGFEALLESYSLVKGRWWAVFGRIAFLALVAAGMFICYGIAVFIISFVTSSIMPAQMSAFIPMVLMITMEIIILSFSIVYLYQLYSSLKLTRQIDVQISSAKPWLVAFMIIGIVVAIAYISIVAVTVNSGFNQMSQSVHYQTQINHNNF